MPLSADTFRSVKTVAQREVAVPVAAATTIYAGALVCRNATGYAVPAADAAGLVCLGFAKVGYDNSGGSDGVVGTYNERFCVVDHHAIASYPLDAGSGAPITSQTAYVADDGSVSTLPGANGIVAGEFFEPDAVTTSNWFVDHSRR